MGTVRELIVMSTTRDSKCPSLIGLALTRELESAEVVPFVTTGALYWSIAQTLLYRVLVRERKPDHVHERSTRDNLSPYEARGPLVENFLQA